MNDIKTKVTLGYIPDNCIENAISIDEMSIVYSQLPDECSCPEEYQYLKISTKKTLNAEDDADKAFYFDISIKECDHWSVENEEQLADLVRDFKRRLKLGTVKESELKVYKHESENILLCADGSSNK